MGLKAGFFKGISAGLKFRPPVGDWQAGQNQANTQSAVKQGRGTQDRDFRQGTEKQETELARVQWYKRKH